MRTPTELITDPEDFWNTRHRSSDEWRSGGDRGLSIAANRSFYLHRLGLIVSLFDELVFADRLRLLDAGCGKGWLTDALSTVGHDVTGIDCSPTAIEICRKHRQGTFAEAALHEFSDPAGFDAAISLDVMFHILDDDVWQRSLRNLAANLRSGGLLVLSDTDVEEQTTSGNYIVYRPFEAYLSALEPFSAKLVATRHYQFSENHNTLMALRVS